MRPVLTSITPAAIGAAATPGISGTYSKADHIHSWAAKNTVTIDATITGSADTNGTPNTPINVGSALPTGALIVAVVVTVTTPASGGSVATADLDVGWSGATETLIKDLDLVAAAAGQYNAGASASSLLRPTPASAKQVAVIVTPDGSHKLSALTALSATIDVYYVVQF